MMFDQNPWTLISLLFFEGQLIFTSFSVRKFLVFSILGHDKLLFDWVHPYNEKKKDVTRPHERLQREKFFYTIVYKNSNVDMPLSV